MINFNNAKKYISFSLLGMILWSCKNERFEINTDNVSIQIENKRFDKQLKNSVSSTEFIKKTSGAYLDLVDVYSKFVIRTGDINDSLTLLKIDDFKNSDVYTEIQTEIDLKFPDVQIYQKELETYFKRLKILFPKVNTPKIAFFNSGFNFGTFNTENAIGIGLEMYLGEENEVVKKVHFPKYRKMLMDEKYITVDVINSVLQFMAFEQPNYNDMLGALVHHGKIMYTLDLILNDKPLSTKLKYSEEQLNWVEQNKDKIWNVLAKNEYIYSKDQKIISQFFNEAPFVSWLSQESTPRIGWWLGYQMIKAHAEKNTDLTFDQLMKEKNYLSILKSYRS